jgi:hypothetical protein
MKLRQGFVSNSSSSSFICDVCGKVVSGFDLSFSDVDMISFSCEHTICNCHIKLPSDRQCLIMTLEELIVDMKNDIEKSDEKNKPRLQKDLDEYCQELEKVMADTNRELDYTELLYKCEFEYMAPQSLCPICSFKIIQEESLVDYLLKTTDVTKAQVFAEIKKTNKRRKKLYNSEYIDYCCNQGCKSRQTIEEEIIRRFDDYEQFYSFLSDKEE